MPEPIVLLPVIYFGWNWLSKSRQISAQQFDIAALQEEVERLRANNQMKNIALFSLLGGVGCYTFYKLHQVRRGGGGGGGAPFTGGGGGSGPDAGDDDSDSSTPSASSSRFTVVSTPTAAPSSVVSECDFHEALSDMHPVSAPQ